MSSAFISMQTNLFIKLQYLNPWREALKYKGSSWLDFKLIKIPAATASQGQPQIIMSGGSQYGNQVAYQNIIPTAVPLQIINQANAVQPGQQFILIDQELD